MRLDQFRNQFMLIVAGVAFFFCSSAKAQRQLPPLPADVQVMLHVDNTDGIISELKHLRTLIDDDHLLEILFEEPHPLFTDEQQGSFQDQFSRPIDQLIEILEQTSSITFFATSLQTEPEFGLWLYTKQEKTVVSFYQSVLALVDHSALNSDKGSDSNLDQSSSSDPEKSKDLLRIFSNWWQELGEIYYDASENSISISNSKRLSSWMSQTSGRDKILTDSRRFLRAVSGVAQDSPDILAFVIPEVVLPLWDSRFSPEYLAGYGYEEMVGAAASVSFADSELAPDAQRAPLMELSFDVPFTRPASGVVKEWQSYRPLTEMPQLASFIDSLKDETPYFLSLTSQDRKEWFQIKEELSRQNGDLEKWDAALAPYIEYSGSLSNFRDFCDGDEVVIRFSSSDPIPQNHLLHLQHIRDQATTKQYLANYLAYTNRDNNMPKEKTKVSGYEAWFQSNENAIRQAEIDYNVTISDSNQHLVRNSGYAIADDWLIQSDKAVMEQYFENTRRRNKMVGRELEKCFAGAGQLIRKHQPSYVELRFANSRMENALHQLRMSYLTTQMSSREARALAMDWDHSVPSIDNIEVKSTSDRLFLVADWFVERLFERFNRDARCFSCQDDHFEWHWGFYSPAK